MLEAHDQDLLDAAYRAYLTTHPSPPDPSLLLQTIVTGPGRRALRSIIPVQTGWSCLDLGTGYGPLAFDLAGAQPVRVVGVDRDEGVLAAAAAIGHELVGSLPRGTVVQFLGGAAEDLPLCDGSFDLVTARLLFQHLPDPSRVADETWRVLRPGGIVCAFDVDDGLSVTYPPEDRPLSELEGAYGVWQTRSGGDRQVGRKLSVLFASRGFSVEAVHVLAQAQHSLSEPGDLVRTVTASRLRAGRGGIVASGLLDATTFDQRLREFEQGPPTAQCRIEGQLAVIARKPPSGA